MPRILRDTLLVGLFFGFLFAWSLSAPSRDFSSPVSFRVEQGVGFFDIARILTDEHLIRSRLAFRVYGFFSGTAHRLKPGVYVVREPHSVPSLISLLVKGPEAVNVTIVPGMTIKEIDARLASFSILPPGALVAFNTPASLHALRGDYPWLSSVSTLEGILSPDTYSFFPQSTPDTVVRRMLDAFAKKALTFFDAGDNLSRVVVLASLLEKEVPEYEDRRLVAGILLKRLSVGMPLQIDATVIYAVCGGKFLGCPPLREADFSFASPYNTYASSKMPPSAIGSPSADAIRAMLNPQGSAYWYYLSDPKTRRTIFSKTLDEHNANRARYILNKR